MKRTIAIGLIVPLLLLAAAFALSPITRANTQKEHLWLMETLLPGGTDFKLVPYDGEDPLIRSVHQSDAGYILECAAQGYADEIVLYIGVKKTGGITGLVVYEAHETPGLGNRILTDHGFLSQFLNQSGPFRIGAAEADAFSSATGTSTGDEMAVDGISGATVSSKAVARCVNSAVAYVTGADITSSATTWGG